MTPRRDAWWSDPRYAALLVALMAVPLLLPAVPPLTDLPGHLARYHIALEQGRPSALSAWFTLHWTLIGNLGVDLLVMPLGRAMGVEAATKLVVVAIPMLTVAGWLWIAREVHGRIPPTAAFALPLAYGYPFQFGFVNYCLAMGLALCAFAWWMRLGRLGRHRRRAAAFVVVGIVIWLAHAFGWAVLALMVVGEGAAARRAAGRGWGGSVWHGAAAALPLIPPVALMLAWRSGAVAGDTGDWFDWAAKLGWVVGALRERCEWFDRASVALLLFVALAVGVRGPCGLDRRLAAVALLLLAAFIGLPRILLGSAYADMRLAPYVLAMAVIAIRPPPAGGGQGLALAALAFLAARLAGSTLAFVTLDHGYVRQLAALDRLPRGARVFALVGTRCQSDWSGDRLEHVPSLAIVRREAFANDQWSLAGAQTLQVHFPAPPPFTTDPGQIVRPAACRATGEASWAAVDAFPRGAFDYLWLVDAPAAARPRDPALPSVWQGAGGALYRIDHRSERDR